MQFPRLPYAKNMSVPNLGMVIIYILSDVNDLRAQWPARPSKYLRACKHIQIHARAEPRALPMEIGMCRNAPLADAVF